MPKARTLEETFHRIADKRGADECWLWTGKRNVKGYGTIARRQVTDGQRYFMATHVAWEIANKLAWPDGKMALHSCDNPPCVNPAHIRPGTAAENAADMVAKGRWGGGRPRDPRASKGVR